jgi:DNA-binding transcriptional regulator YdaS (Cro superfamily)
MNLSQYIATGKDTQSSLSAKLGMKNSVLVNQWVNGVRQVPAERCPAIERATDGVVRCEDLRPDVDWGVLRGDPAEVAA